MKILLVAKLSDQMLSSLIITPLLNVPTIDHIYILRDTSGIEFNNKVTYLIPDKSSKNNIIRHLVKIKDGIRYCKSLKVDVVLGILIYPHGYIGQTISRLAHKPYIHITIAGHREFRVFGKIVERINLIFFKKSLAISVTGNTTLNYLKSKGFSSQKIIVLPNVIDMESYYSFEQKRTYDIISLSRLDKNKNVSLLLRAISRIKGISTINALIVGVGSELENLKNEAEQLAISDRVHFVGWIEENKKIEIYNSCKIFVLCSKGEGFPLSLLEAMACGCVPVVSGVGDITDVVRNKENGFVVKDLDNEEELSCVLNDLLFNPEKISILSKEATKVRDTYGYGNISKTWFEMLTRAKSQFGSFETSNFSN